MSVARNCHVSNKPKADIAVILPSSSPSMLRLTGTRRRKEVKRSNSIAHFTVAGENEAGVDLVLIQPFLLYYVNHVFLMLTSIF